MTRPDREWLESRIRRLPGVSDDPITIREVMAYVAAHVMWERDRAWEQGLADGRMQGNYNNN